MLKDITLFIPKSWINVFTILFLFLPVYSFSQYYQIKKFTIEDGLTSNDIATVTQDSYGFIWIRTNDLKICRFDGKNFQSFSNKNGDFVLEDVERNIHLGNKIFHNGKFEEKKNDTIVNLEIIYSEGNQMISESTGFMDNWGGNWKIDPSPNRIIYRYFKGENIKIDTNYGLPANFYSEISAIDQPVLDIYTDRNNTIWLRSNIGYFYFDGSKLINSGLTAPNLYAFKDSKSRIWAKSYNENDTIYLVEKGKLSKIDKKTLAVSSIGNIIEDKIGNIWLNASGSVLLVYKDNKFVSISTKGDFLIEGVCQNNDLVLQNKADKMLYKYTINGIEKLVMPSEIKIEKFNPIYIDKEDNIWLRSSNGLYLITKSKLGFSEYKNFKNFNPDKNDIRHLFNSSKGKCYLFIYQRGIYLLEKDSLINVIEDDDIYPEDVIEDSEERIWVTTRSISKDHFLNIYIIKKDKAEIVNLSKVDNNFDSKKITIWPKFTIDKIGNINLISKNYGFIQFSKNTIHFHQLNSIKGDKVNEQIIEDFGKKEILIEKTRGSKREVLKWNEINNSFDKLMGDENKISQYTDGFYKLNGNYLLFQTKNDLIILKGNTQIKYKYNDSIKQPTLDSRFFEDKNGHLWFLTYDGKQTVSYGQTTGLNEVFFDKLGHFHAKFYDENSIIKTNNVKDIYIDNKEIPWLAVESNLMKIKFNEIESYDFKNLTGGNHIRHIEQSNNILNGFTEKGIVHLYNFSGITNTVTPNVNIKNIGFESYGVGQNKVIKMWEFDLPENLILNYKENNVFFEVRGLSFSDISKVQFKYLLEGYDDNWSLPTSNTFIKYTNLPEGLYTLNVVCCNNENVWSEKPTTYSFRILAPWYRTWIAYFFYLVISISSLYMFVKSRTKKIIKEKEKLETIVAERTAEVIQEKKIIIEQKQYIEEKHKEITDSINYAERIQRSFIATKELLDENLKDYFVMFQPKDVVSGDFYWAGKLNNGNFALATADSTGHGVPGAIMSLLNITSIEKAIESTNQPNEILNATRKNIIERLKKDGSVEGGKDGMDVSLTVYDPKKKKLTVSAANNPVWIVRGNETIDIKPDKMPVGKHDKDSVSFTQQEIDLQKGDVVYTLTDGFPDQFGGEKGKKFMSKNLRELLASNAQLPMTEQKQLLEKTFADWVGNLEQVDDVTIVGVRV